MFDTRNGPHKAFSFHRGGPPRNIFQKLTLFNECSNDVEVVVRASSAAVVGPFAGVAAAVDAEAAVFLDMHIDSIHAGLVGTQKRVLAVNPEKPAHAFETSHSATPPATPPST